MHRNIQYMPSTNLPKRKRARLTPLFLCAALFSAPVSPTTIQELQKEMADGFSRFEKAYSAWSDTQFVAVARFYGARERAYPGCYLPAYWQGVIHFYLVSYYLFGYEKDIDKRRAALYIDSALTCLKRAERLSPGNAEITALTGTLYGIAIYLNPLKAVTLGSAVLKATKKAASADSVNPRVYYLTGMSYYHTPRLMGGGFETGLKYLLKADTLFERESIESKDNLKPRWGHSTCLGFAGNIYLKKGMRADAETYFKKALAINPEDKIARKGLAGAGKR